jgi:rhodanese-related sulfurtransferase
MVHDRAALIVRICTPALQFFSNHACLAGEVAGTSKESSGVCPEFEHSTPSMNAMLSPLLLHANEKRRHPMDHPLLEILPSAVHDRRASGRQLHLVDVRSSSEYWRGHPHGAISIPIEQISRQVILRKLGEQAGREKPLYLISGNGRRAMQAAGKLLQEGLPQLLLVRGGTRAWFDDYRLP